jgi:hypothetical protein
MPSSTFSLGRVMAAYVAPAMAAPMTGATRNSHIWANAAPPANQGHPQRTRRVHRQVGHRNPHQVDHSQPEPDGDWGKALRRPVVGGTQDDVEEDRGQHDLGDQRRDQSEVSG